MALTQPQPINYELHDPDVRLMMLVRAGDAAAFTELVERYRNRLLTVLEPLVGNHEQAEDLAQEGFLRVFKASHRYEPGAKFSTWLFTIANNVASNALRSRSRRREVGVPEGNGSDSAPMQLDQLAKAASGFMPTRALDKALEAELTSVAVNPAVALRTPDAAEHEKLLAEDLRAALKDSSTDPATALKAASERWEKLDAKKDEATRRREYRQSLGLATR